ncbi:hypothetical protein EUX98_g4747 [Antrodiella citrinella]|uniref:Uncharacterized protein n=1 Tax=Antrodiella citrinella TaxID=2447956 RepID=A0A4S4MVZ1_9APHY|nr:hypothetical protein EUX98_g4747 [Antrodiella citrinella]
MYDYHTDTLHLGTPIASAFGNRDLYKDDEDAANVYHIEQLFSKLESQAAQILEKLDSAVMMSRRTVGNSVSLTRKQVNTLRKFLWLLPYRSERHANQFLEGNFDSATCRSVDDFRRKHALKDIYAVWLFNLRNILESEHWEIATNENILQADREAYMEEAQHRQLAFFVAPTGFEFILTNNSLGLWEANVKYIPPLHPTKLARMDMKEIGCRVNDILTFRIHMLDEEQALRVNALRLENTPRWIMFKSLHKLLDYIQYYEQNEGTQGAGPIVGGPAYYSKRTYDSLARQLEFIEFGVSRQFPAFVPLPFGIPTGTSFELQNETYMPMRLDSNGIHDIEEDMQRAEVTLAVLGLLGRSIQRSFL